MTKAELIDRIARNRDLPPEVTKKVIAKILDLAFSELSGYFVRARVTRTSSPRFTFPKFGTFTKKQRSGRRGVNPRTLEPMEIEACETVDFKPSVELKRQMNEAASAKPSNSKAARKKKAARSSSKRKSSSSNGVTPGVKPETNKTRAAGPGGRKLVTREEAELEPPSVDPLLPDAPLRRVARRRKGDTDLEGTGS
ncbi:MAG: HU family DNA-binding protein [Enhygromyxa sp.]